MYNYYLTKEEANTKFMSLMTIVYC